MILSQRLKKINHLAYDICYFFYLRELLRKLDDSPTYKGGFRGLRGPWPTKMPNIVQHDTDTT